MYEKKYRELIDNSQHFVSINDIRLDIDNVEECDQVSSVKFIVFRN